MKTMLQKIRQARNTYLQTIQQHRDSVHDVIIYGAGKFGRVLFRFLSERNIPVAAFCVTNPVYNLRSIEGIPVLAFDECLKTSQTVIFVVAVKTPANQGIVAELQKRSCNYIDIPEFFEEMFDEAFLRPVLEITPKAGCSVNCRYCPQELFLNRYYAYSNKREMSFVDFKQCIDKTPKNLMIDFSGFVEPFLARDAVEMMKYANSIGRDIRLFTTLVGLEMEQFDVIEKIPFKRVVLHLPDVKGFANIPLTEDYWRLLERVVNAHKPGGTPFVDAANCQCEPHPKAVEIINQKIMISWNLIDRAGNLDGETLRSTDWKNQKIYCSRAANVDHNVLLPNGDVVLCCMDFGLKYVLGNIMEQSYEEIVQGVFKASDVPALCKKCSEAKAMKE